MIKIILEIKEEENITFKNKKTLATGLNVAIKEVGINATIGEEKGAELMLKKLNVEEKIQVYNEGKDKKMEEFIRNLLGI